MADEFTIKDSGQRQEFASGMVRDVADDKIEYTSMRLGPMFKRWAEHLTKGRRKYPDVAPGVPNWTLAAGEAEYTRAQESAARHFEAWLAGQRDEDHAAGVFFNINLAEYVRDKMDLENERVATPAKFSLRCNRPGYEGTLLCDSCKSNLGRCAAS